VSGASFVLWCIGQDAQIGKSAFVDRATVVMSATGAHSPVTTTIVLPARLSESASPSTANGSAPTFTVSVADGSKSVVSAVALPFSPPRLYLEAKQVWPSAICGISGVKFHEVNGQYCKYLIQYCTYCVCKRTDHGQTANPVHIHLTNSPRLRSSFRVRPSCASVLPQTGKEMRCEGEAGSTIERWEPRRSTHSPCFGPSKLPITTRCCNAMMRIREVRSYVQSCTAVFANGANSGYISKKRKQNMGFTSSPLSTSPLHSLLSPLLP
jgi:hypothetical protein